MNHSRLLKKSINFNYKLEPAMLFSEGKWDAEAEDNLNVICFSSISIRILTSEAQQ